MTRLGDAVNRMLAGGVLALLVSISGFAQQSAGNNNGAGWGFLQVQHLAGDQDVGFTRGCLLVRANGRYHRETRHQKSINGHPQQFWEPATVFEGTLPVEELQKLRSIVDAADFRATSGTIGDPSSLRSKLSIWAIGGGATPHGNIDVLATSVARARTSQVFEVFVGSVRLEDSLKLFLAWVHNLEKRRDGLVHEALTNDCTTSPSHGTGVPWEPTTSLVAKPISASPPDYPIDERNAKHSGTVLVEVLVNVDGSVGQVSIKRGINPVLDQKALEAVRKWKFVPAEVDSMPVAMRTVVEVDFRLQ